MPIIEGDGTIHRPKSERSTKGNLNYPFIQIVFHLKDLPLALLVQKELGFGSISKKKKVLMLIFLLLTIIKVWCYLLIYLMVRWELINYLLYTD